MYRGKYSTHSIWYYPWFQGPLRVRNVTPTDKGQCCLSLPEPKPMLPNFKSAIVYINVGYSGLTEVYSSALDTLPHHSYNYGVSHIPVFHSQPAMYLAPPGVLKYTACGDERTDPEIRTVINMDKNYSYQLTIAVICIKYLPGFRHCARSFVHILIHVIFQCAV